LEDRSGSGDVVEAGIGQRPSSNSQDGREHRANNAAAEVDAATALQLGDHEQAAQAAGQLAEAGEPEHSAY
jgi:hypothetical protein